MRQLPLQQIRQLCVPAKRQFGGACLCSRQTLVTRRHFARQSSLRVVAQARKSLMMRELERGKAEVQEEEEDNRIPSG